MGLSIPKHFSNPVTSGLKVVSPGILGLTSHIKGDRWHPATAPDGKFGLPAFPIIVNVYFICFSVHASTFQALKYLNLPPWVTVPHYDRLKDLTLFFKNFLAQLRFKVHLIALMWFHGAHETCELGSGLNSFIVFTIRYHCESEYVWCLEYRENGRLGPEVVLWRHPMTSYEKLTYTRNCK